MNKVLMVLGMHRSGTSLVSNWLYKCNLKLGDRLLEGDPFNSNGHFEDLDFLYLHEEILKFLHVDQSGLFLPLEIELNNYYYKKLKSNVLFKCSLYKQWGWKDPRTCLFIEFYKKIIPTAKYFILFRDYKFVVDSLIRRDLKYIDIQYNKLNDSDKILYSQRYNQEKERIDLLKNSYLSVWIFYNQKILNLINLSRKNDYLVINYNDLRIIDKHIFSKLVNWGFKLEYHSFSDIIDNNLINENTPNINFDTSLEHRAIELGNAISNFMEKNN